MGYEIPIRKGRLTLDSHPGLDVEARLTVPFELFEMFMRLGAGISEDFTAGLRRFGDEFLISWNLTSEGTPIPANGEGLMSLPSDMVLGLLNAWLTAVQEPRGPLESGSSTSSDSPARLTGEPGEK